MATVMVMWQVASRAFDAVEAVYPVPDAAAPELSRSVAAAVPAPRVDAAAARLATWRPHAAVVALDLAAGSSVQRHRLAVVAAAARCCCTPECSRTRRPEEAARRRASGSSWESSAHRAFRD